MNISGQTQNTNLGEGGGGPMKHKNMRGKGDEETAETGGRTNKTHKHLGERTNLQTKLVKDRHKEIHIEVVPT